MLAEFKGGAVQLITETENELEVDVRGVLNSTVDTTIMIVQLNLILLVIDKIPEELPKLRGEDAEYYEPSLKYAA